MENRYAYNPRSTFSTHTIIINLIGKGHSVLDIGCNDGYIGKHADSSNTFYGVDYLDKSIGLAKQHYADAAVYDLNDTKPLPWDKKFDYIVCADVLEHIIDPERTLSNLVKHHLNPGGTVIVSLPNVANWQVRFPLLFGSFNYVKASGIMDSTHFHLYTFKTSRDLLTEAGLKTTRQIAGANLLGIIAKYLPFTRGLVAMNIISVGVKA